MKIIIGFNLCLKLRWCMVYEYNNLIALLQLKDYSIPGPICYI